MTNSTHCYSKLNGVFSKSRASRLMNSNLYTMLGPMRCGIFQLQLEELKEADGQVASSQAEEIGQASGDPVVMSNASFTSC